MSLYFDIDNNCDDDDQRRKQKRDRTRKPVDYAESTPIPPEIQAKITEILISRGLLVPKQN